MNDVQTLIDDIRRYDSMSDSELLKIRRAFGRDLIFTLEEANAVFDLNSVTNKPDDWPPYFRSVLAAYVDDSGKPDGVVSEDNADWLISKISEDGVVKTETELRLLLNVLRTAHHVPDRLQQFALDQILIAIKTGDGKVYGRTLTPNVVGEAEVELLRNVLYASSGEGGISISRTEAEALFDLNDATSGQANHPSWQTLFVHAIANHLMVLARPKNAKPRESADLSFITDSHRPSSGLTIIKSFQALFSQMKEPKPEILAQIKADAVASAEVIDLDEAQWLLNRLFADGTQDENETALLQFIKTECPDIDKALQRYL